MFSINVTFLCILFSVGLLLVNFCSAHLYSKYCITSNLWNIIFLVGSPACQTITMVQAKTLEMYNTIWYSFAIGLCSMMYTMLTWVVSYPALKNRSTQNQICWAKKSSLF
jgi:hypothetical protein